MINTVLQEEIQTIGRDLLLLACQEEESLVKKHFWENALLDWCMKDEDLKIRFFRFIDVFPQLNSSKAILRHIREYFPLNEQRIPKSIRTGLLLTHPTFLTQRAFAHITRLMFLKIAKLFIAATKEEEAIQVLEDLDSQGVLCSIDLLGEKTLSEREASAYFHRYQDLIRILGKKKLGRKKQNVSVKLSALDPRFDPVDEETSLRVRKRLRELMRLALQEDVFVHIDMEEYHLRDLTLKIVKDLCQENEFKNGLPLGIVLQAYLKDAEDVFEEILSWAKRLPLPLSIRLVRGAYWDQEIMTALENNWPIPVFTLKNETDGMFEHLLERILKETSFVHLALATHNIRSIAKTIALARLNHLDEGTFEFQLLYGMGFPLMGALRAMNFSPRMYMPLGDPVWGMSYLVRRLLENVSSQSFVRRGIHQKADPEELLAPLKPRQYPDLKNAYSIDKTYFTELKKENTYEECPALMFFDSKIRETFQLTLKDVLTYFPQRIPLRIGQKHLHKREVIHTISPNDGQTVIAMASKADRNDCAEAIKCAQQNLSSWRRVSMKERCHYLRTAAKLMLAKRFELACLQVWEVGKPMIEADMDVKEAVDYLNYYAQLAEELEERNLTRSLPQERNTISLRPRGVSVVISPWNFPMAILTGMSSASLVCGNTVILKPAEQALLCGYKIFELLIEAGIPAGVINFLSGMGEEIGPLLVEDPTVALIAFTGSKEVGLDIIARANRQMNIQRHIKKVISEMGGKNACIVDETADFDQAIPAILDSAFSYAGQKCSALSRLIVLDSIYESFIKRLIEAAESFPSGDPTQAFVKCGPVIDQVSYERILAALEKGRKTGRLIFQGKIERIKNGFYVPPAILTDLPHDSPLLKEEIFGPVLVVIRVKTFGEAIQKANETDFALTGGLFSRTPTHIERGKRELEVGNLYINRSMTGAVVGRHPFGGYNLSGTGTKAGGMNYLKEFVIERTISENISRHGFAPLGKEFPSQ